ncbi:MAG TPA: protein kinase [Candidatus Eisenbacteria bacterium]|jgi:serine/threonine protein kinase/tetratricopeptide (TPR) repeat protein|nr:protein kinase [Candidatus Eisenbacteria bacterium]
MSMAAGTKIGVYEIQGPLGAGGMGEIYRARDTRLDRTVAIKALPQGFASDPALLARFEREAKLLASLSHPNIAGIYGIEDSQGAPYLVLEYVAGHTLADRLSKGALPPAEAARLGAAIASAIEAAHGRGIVHRDLKPGNVMVTPSGDVKVLDFGIAKGDGVAVGAAAPTSATVAQTMTGEGVILGTAAYMSPEQARGLTVDRRSDVWSFGCVLFECLAGARPFQGQTVTDVIVRVLEREPDWSALPVATPARLREVIRRCLRKSADDRPDRMEDLRRELESIATEAAAMGKSGASASPSLAVLYFENLSSDPESEYFCAGITEDILTDLSKIKGMRVASRNAVARFRGTVVDIPKVAAELGVTAVMEGSVRKAGDRVRITAQLINAADGFHLWADRFDRKLEDVFAVQEEIASSITSALRVALTPSEAKEIKRDRPSNARAYDLYLKGREQYGRYTLESLESALALFRQAIELEPGYALAWAGIGDVYGQFRQWGADDSGGKMLRQGLEAARKAIAIDPKLPDGHKAEALVLRGMGEVEAQAAALKRAYEADPRYTPALCNLAVTQWEGGDIAGSERLYRRALQIDPQEPFAMLWIMQILQMTGRFEETLTAAAELMRISAVPFYTNGARAMTALAYLGLGRLSEAEASIDVSSMSSGNAELMRALLDYHAGDRSRALELVERAEAAPQLAPVLAFQGAAILTSLGKRDLARRIMSRPITKSHIPIRIRIIPELWPIADEAPYAPARSAMTLVWPSEAPPPMPGVEERFAAVRYESGMP